MLLRSNDKPHAWDASVACRRPGARPAGCAAQAQHCRTLLSEDFQNGMVFGQLTVRNPFEANVAESPAAYEVAIKPRPRHRSRGSPAAAPKEP
jgi:hypothetical protein